MSYYLNIFLSFYAYFFHFNVALVILFVTFADLESKSNFEENTKKSECIGNFVCDFCRFRAKEQNTKK